jgi:hypothetical protein
MIEHAALHWDPLAFGLVSAGLIVAAVLIVLAFGLGGAWSIWLKLRSPRRLSRTWDWRVR